MQAVKRVTSLDAASIDPLAKLLAGAFNVHDDPIQGLLYGSVPDPEAYLDMRFKHRAYEAVRDDEVYVIEAAGLVAAALILVRPGGRRHSEETQATPYTDELKRMTPPDVVERQKILVDAANELESEFGDEAYYISSLATAPWARGKGLAGVLIRHALDRARADGRLTTLSTGTPSNVPLYEKFGFKIIGTREVQIGQKRLEVWAMDNAESEGHL